MPGKSLKSLLSQECCFSSFRNWLILAGQDKSPNLEEVRIPAKTNSKKEDSEDEAEEETLDAVDEGGEDPGQPPRDVLHQSVHLPIKNEE